MIGMVDHGQNLLRNALLHRQHRHRRGLFRPRRARSWGIENELHWTLDVAFREDDSRVREPAARENLAVLRHIALTRLKKRQDQTWHQEQTPESGLGRALPRQVAIRVTRFHRENNTIRFPEKGVVG